MALETNNILRFEDYFPQNGTWFYISTFPSKEGLSAYFDDITGRLHYVKATEEQNENLKEVPWLPSLEIKPPFARIRGLIQLISALYADITAQQNSLNHLAAPAHELDKAICTIPIKPIRRKESQLLWTNICLPSKVPLNMILPADKTFDHCII